MSKNRTGKNWEEWELEFLTHRFNEGWSDADIAKSLARSVSSVQKIRAKRGLGRYKPRTPKTASFATEDPIPDSLPTPPEHLITSLTNQPTSQADQVTAAINEISETASEIAKTLKELKEMQHTNTQLIRQIRDIQQRVDTSILELASQGKIAAGIQKKRLEILQNGGATNGKRV